jgi:hypothetical protein
MIIGTAHSSSIARTPVCADCLLSRIARDADLGSVMQKGSRCFGVWDLCRPSMSKLSHRAKGRTLKRRINITSRAGALMDLTVPRNARYSGCAVWRKLRPDILRC